MKKQAQKDQIRFNLQIPLSLKNSLDLLAQIQGIRTTVLVKKILHDVINENQQKELEQNLIEGYHYLSEEYKQICEDFNYIDSEVD